MSDVRDRWAAGSSYEQFMGRWSRPLAPRFVSWLALPAGLHWLDVGCGTGSLTSAICGGASPASVVACDPAKPLIEFARQQSLDPRVSFVAGGAGSLPRRAGGYGSVTSLLALNFFPDPAAALEEMASVAAPNAVISACVWDYAAGMEFLRRFWDAAAALDPAAADLDEGRRFPLCHPDVLTALFERGRFRDVRHDSIDIPTAFASFEDYWQPLLGGTGPVPSYVASLDASRRTALARRLEETLSRGRNGTIALTARAWVARGTVGE